MKIVTYPVIEKEENREWVRGHVEHAVRSICDILAFDPELLDTIAIADPEHLGQAVKEVANSETGGYTNRDGAIMGGKTSSFRAEDGSLRFRLVFNSALLSSIPEIERTETGWRLSAQNWDLDKQVQFSAIAHEIGHCIDALERGHDYDGKAIWAKGFEVQKHLDWSAGCFIDEFAASFYSATIISPDVFRHNTEFSGSLLLRQLKSLQKLTAEYQDGLTDDLFPIALGAVDIGFRFLYLNAIALGMRFGKEELRECPLFFWESEKELLNDFDEALLDAARSKDETKIEAGKQRLGELMERLILSLGFKFKRTFSEDSGDGIFWDTPTLNFAIFKVEEALSKFREKHGQLVAEVDPSENENSEEI